MMGSIRQNILVNGKEHWTLFDTGARNTYITPGVAEGLVISQRATPFRSQLGGGIKETTQTAILDADIDGNELSTHAMVINEIGKDEDGRDIEILFGALAMQQWGIRPVPETEELDLSHFTKEFLEF
jgi:hypothetical protein